MKCNMQSQLLQLEMSSKVDQQVHVQAWATWLCRAGILAVASREATEVAVAATAVAWVAVRAWASSSMVGEEGGTRRCACCCSGPPSEDLGGIWWAAFLCSCSSLDKSAPRCVANHCTGQQGRWSLLLPRGILPVLAEVVV